MILVRNFEIKIVLNQNDYKNNYFLLEFLFLYNFVLFSKMYIKLLKSFTLKSFIIASIVIKWYELLILYKNSLSLILQNFAFLDPKNALKIAKIYILCLLKFYGKILKDIQKYFKWNNKRR